MRNNWNSGENTKDNQNKYNIKIELYAFHFGQINGSKTEL